MDELLIIYLLVLLFIIFASIDSCARDYMQHIENNKAMENGYQQVVIDGKKVWQKSLERSDNEN